MGVCDFWKTPSLQRNKLLYQCKISWNRIVKGIEILILKKFDIVYKKIMIEKWCGILLIHKQ
jgi:hypothetical protein